MMVRELQAVAVRIAKRGARGILPTLALLLVSSAFALLLAEGLFRILGTVWGVDHRLYLTELKRTTRFPASIWVSDPEVEWPALRHYPPFRPGARGLVTTSEFSHVFRINSNGLRDTEHTYERPPGVRRFIALGDSYTFGAGIADGARFVDVAEQALEGVELINMGVPGYSLDQALLSYLAEGRRYAPDAVLLFVNHQMTWRHHASIYEDGEVRIPEDLSSAADEAAGGPETAYLQADDPLFEEASWIARHSHIVSYVGYQIQVWRMRARLRAQDREFWKGKEWRGPPGAFIDDWDARRRERAIAILEAFRDVCQADGSPLIVMNIDSDMSLNYLGSIPGLEFFNLSGELSSLGERQRLSFVYDQHYNPRTHRFIGLRVAEILRDVVDRADGIATSHLR